jgi:DNA-binding transcriptional LysR family regulator
VRLVNKINLNYLRIFEAVYRLSSMTEAARELKLTQSGVSQHIKGLETQLNVRLFERENQLLTPTPTATNLFLRCSEGLSLFENTFLEITGEAQSLGGNITIGTPPEFGDAVLIPKLARFLNNHREVKLTVKVGQSTELLKWLLDGEIDFAFMDSFIQDKRVLSEPIYDELVELCILQASMKNLSAPSNRKSFYESLEYVSYVQDEKVLDMWFEHHLKTRKLSLKIRALGTTCDSVGQLVVNGVGAGILPGEQITRLEREGHKLYRFEGCRRPLVNQISLIRKRAAETSFLSKTLRLWLLEIFHETHPPLTLKKTG